MLCYKLVQILVVGSQTTHSVDDGNFTRVDKWQVPWQLHMHRAHEPFAPQLFLPGFLLTSNNPVSREWVNTSPGKPDKAANSSWSIPLRKKNLEKNRLVDSRARANSNHAQTAPSALRGRRGWLLTCKLKLIWFFVLPRPRWILHCNLVYSCKNLCIEIKTIPAKLFSIYSYLFWFEH